MKRIALLLISVMTALLFVGGVAFAATKQCENTDSSEINDDCFGTEEDDTLLGTNEVDSIYGRGGNDTIRGLDYEDFLYGEGGADSLYGGEGYDSLEGGPGADKLYGGSYGDRYYVVEPNSGNDVIVDPFETGTDVGDDDSVWIDDAESGTPVTSNLVINLFSSGSKPEVRAGDGTMTINWSGSVIEDVINSGTGNDVIFGNNVRNAISSGEGGADPGADRVYAKGGNDVVYVNDDDPNDFVDCGEPTVEGVKDNDGVRYDRGDRVVNCERRAAF